MNTEPWEKEFDYKFIHKGEDGDDPADQWAWTIIGSYPIEIKLYIKKLLLSHTEAQEKALRKKIEGMKKDIDNYAPPAMFNMQIGYNDALENILSSAIDIIVPYAQIQIDFKKK